MSLYALALMSILLLGLISVIPQAYADNLTIRAVGDIPYTDRGKQVAALTKAQDADLTILLGDYYDKTKQVLALFKQSTVDLIAECGNHEDSCRLVMDSDGEKYGTTYPFLVKKENGCVISVNSETSLSKQKTKIESFLRDCQEDPNIDHIIFAQHKATITNSGAHHPEKEYNVRSQYAAWKELYPKFDLLLQGHNHNFQICEPEIPNILVVTIGTGSREPYPIGSFGGNDNEDHCDVNQSGHKFDGPAVITVGDNTGQYSISKKNLG